MTLSRFELRASSRSDFALVLAALALGAAACDDTPQAPQAPPEVLEMQADMIGYDTDTYVNVDGIRSAKILSDSAFYFNDSSAVHMHGVEMEIYTDEGAVRATVTAERARYDRNTQGMHALGNVVLVMPQDDRRVESPELWYEPNEERIWSDSASTYHRNGQITRGTCFRSDMTFQNFTVCNIRGSADVGRGS